MNDMHRRPPGRMAHVFAVAAIVAVLTALTVAAFALAATVL